MSSALRIAGLCVVLGFGLVAKNALAADTLVLCDSVTSELSGESVVAGAAKCIDVQSWTWGSQAPVSYGTGGPSISKAALEDLTLQKAVDTSTTTFFKFLVSGSYFHGTLQLRIYTTCNAACQTPAPYFTIDMTDSFVTKQSIGGSTDGRPSESISLTYKTIKVCYRQTDNSGMLLPAVCTTYDRVAGMASGAQQ